jgi:hypothetical protein
MKVSRIALTVAAGLVISSSAQAADWSNAVNGFQGGIGGSNYIAVKPDGTYVPSAQVNADGSFKDTCVGCSWRPAVVGDAAAPGGTAKYTTPYAYAGNPANGSFTAIGADGLLIHNGSLIVNGDNIPGHLSAHDAMLSQHAATLSDHSARLNEHEKGLAIAMAMPDAWLSDKERFAIAGNLGGFGDETAVGLAAIIRVDEHWSLNGKFGSDTQFEQFGWTVGARAGF